MEVALQQLVGTIEVAEWVVSSDTERNGWGAMYLVTQHNMQLLAVTALTSLTASGNGKEQWQSEL